MTARWQTAQPLLRLLDGPHVLWEAAEACWTAFIEDLRQAGQPLVRVDMLDSMQGSTSVWKAAKAFPGHQERQEAFAQERLWRMLRVAVTGVLTGMRRRASQCNLSESALKAVTTAGKYFEKNAQRLRYDEYLKAGYPMARGVSEGACRHVLKDRLEQGGLRWTLAGAEALRNVRAVCASTA